MNELAYVDCGGEGVADILADVPMGKLQATLYMFEDETLRNYGITENLIKKYGPMALQVGPLEFEDTSDSMRLMVREMFAKLPEMPETKPQLFVEADQFPCFYIYGNLRGTVRAFIETGLLSEQDAVSLFEGIDEGMLVAAEMTADDNLLGGMQSAAFRHGPGQG